MSDAISEVPDDPWGAFGYLISRCASGVYKELVESGKTDAQARNAIIHSFLDMASGEACRIARREGREPNKEKWQKATDAAWDRAIKRTPASEISRTEDEIRHMRGTTIHYASNEFVSLMSAHRIVLNGQDVPARFYGHRKGLLERLQAAWLVFTGRADALVWMEDHQT